MGSSLVTNDFVAENAPGYLIKEENVYEIRFKNPNGQHSNFTTNHEVFMELINKYGLKPKWKKWNQVTKKKRDGTEYQGVEEVDA